MKQASSLWRFVGGITITLYNGSAPLILNIASYYTPTSLIYQHKDATFTVVMSRCSSPMDSHIPVEPWHAPRPGLRYRRPRKRLRRLKSGKISDMSSQHCTSMRTKRLTRSSVIWKNIMASSQRAYSHGPIVHTSLFNHLTGLQCTRKSWAHGTLSKI